MCRYASHPAKTHWVCLPCRESKKDSRWRPPPVCRSGHEMTDAGRDFKPPRRWSDQQWRKLALIMRPRLFDSCGCTGPGWRPKTLGEAKREAMAARPNDR